jgi:hypothetical protein
VSLSFEQRQTIRKARSDAKIAAINEIAELTDAYRADRGIEVRARRVGPLELRYPGLPEHHPFEDCPEDETPERGKPFDLAEWLEKA